MLIKAPPRARTVTTDWSVVRAYPCAAQITRHTEPKTNQRGCFDEHRGGDAVISIGACFDENRRGASMRAGFGSGSQREYSDSTVPVQ
eukprot:1176240-Prorocentrum_minimum.AAC.1